MRVFDWDESMLLQHPELSSLIAEGAAKNFVFIATAGGFQLEVTTRTSKRLLYTQRKTPRVFRTLETGLQYLRDMGVIGCTVIFRDFEPRQKSLL